MTTPTRFLDTKVLLGIGIILLGLVALLGNLGIDTGLNLWSLWPVIPILIGIGQLLQPPEYRQWFSGLVLLLVGALFLLNNLGVIEFRLRHMWPIILLAIGLAILRQGLWGARQRGIGSDTISLSAILGGGEFNSTSRQLRGGSITAIMGGCTLNLRDAEPPPGEPAIIDTFAFWGGIEIRVPEGWQVSMEGSPILGGMDNTTRLSSPEGTETPGPRLVIRGLAIMGGVEVKN